MSVQIKDLLVQDGMAEIMAGTNSICVKGREITYIKDTGPDSGEFCALGELSEDEVLSLINDMFGHWVSGEEFIDNIALITSTYTQNRETFVQVKKWPSVTPTHY